MRTERCQIFLVLILINLCVYGALQIYEEFSHSASVCFLCVEKVCSKFQTVLGVWYTPVAIYIHPWFLPVALPSVCQQQRQRTLVGKNYFLEPMMWGIIHPVGPCFFSFWGRIGVLDFFSVPNLFPWNFHSIFMKFASFQYVPQVSNVFPNLFPINSSHFMFKSWFKNFSAELNKDVDQCFFWVAKYCQISTWKIWFQPIQRIFHE